MDSKEQMDLESALRGNFVVVNLGSGSDLDYPVPDRYKRLITLVEIDAADETKTGSAYHKRISLQNGVAPATGRYSFRRNKYVGCSSLLPPDEELIRRYGLEAYYEVERLIEMDCESLPSILDRLGIGHIDFLKTDLEGLDFEIIKSCERLLDGMLAIQCELRFEPLYEGEPYFHEVCAFLHARGFELIQLIPEHWKPRTCHSAKHQDGRVVWADCVFLKNLEICEDIEAVRFAVL